MNPQLSGPVPYLRQVRGPETSLMDSCGRRINYLRLSVTDRCNLRCCYCMPATGAPTVCQEDILTNEELYRVACESVLLGIQKIRITGGEPLVRKGIIALIERLAGIAGLKELVLTTNGLRLRETAMSLRRAGVHRLNISLDSLKADTFAAITRGGDLRRVLDGIAAAEEAGFPPVKINVVVMRGVNDDEVLDFAALTLDKPYTVRFIEYMPTTSYGEWKARYIPGDELLEPIRTRYSLVPLGSAERAGPARNFRIPGSLGSIGIISQMSSHTCHQCNRIRVTASGLAKGCLFADRAIDLKPLLRSGDDDRLKLVLREIVLRKPLRHQLFTQTQRFALSSMSQIGG